MFEGVADLRWQDSAVCAQPGFDPAVMFPKGNVAPRAMAACAACPVIRQCRAHADETEVGAEGRILSRSEIAGFVGGESAAQRVDRRLRAAAAAVADTDQGAAFIAGTDRVLTDA